MKKVRYNQLKFYLVVSLNTNVIIDNPELLGYDELESLPVKYKMNGLILNDNDTFDLPENIGFEEIRLCKKGSCMEMEGCYADGLSFETCAAEVFIRLKYKNEIKEETQEELLDDLYDEISDVTPAQWESYMKNRLKSIFIIQRRPEQ